MTKGEDFIKRGSCKNNQCSSLSNSAWTDLNSKRNIFKLHENALILNVVDKKSLHLRLINTYSKVDRLKANYNKQLRGHKLLGKNLLNQV